MQYLKNCHIFDKTNLTTKNKKIMASNSNNSSLGFTGLLAIVFIALKLTKNIDWSWWWVLAPLWAPALIIIIIVLVIYSKNR